MRQNSSIDATVERLEATGRIAGSRFVRTNDTPLMDSGAGHDPFVGCIQRFFEVEVGDDLVGNMGTGAENTYRRKSVIGRCPRVAIGAVPA